MAEQDMWAQAREVALQIIDDMRTTEPFNRLVVNDSTPAVLEQMLRRYTAKIMGLFSKDTTVTVTRERWLSLTKAHDTLLMENMVFREHTEALIKMAEKYGYHPEKGTSVVAFLASGITELEEKIQYAAKELPALRERLKEVEKSNRMLQDEKAKLERQATFSAATTKPPTKAWTSADLFLEEVTQMWQSENTNKPFRAPSPKELLDWIRENASVAEQMPAIVQVAKEAGWDGVNNSKILSSFLASKLLNKPSHARDILAEKVETSRLAASAGYTKEFLQEEFSKACAEKDEVDGAEQNSLEAAKSKATEAEMLRLIKYYRSRIVELEEKVRVLKVREPAKKPTERGTGETKTKKCPTKGCGENLAIDDRAGYVTCPRCKCDHIVRREAT